MAQFAVDWFGVVAPGRPVVSNFVMVDSAKCTALVERPADICELCFFLLPRCALPPATCAVLYFSADDGAWTVLGSLSAEKPSGTRPATFMRPSAAPEPPVLPSNRSAT